MFRRKNIRFLMFLVIGVIFAVVGIYFYNAQKESRDMYEAIETGEKTVATVYQIPGIDYDAKQTNKYRYTFVAKDGKTYVGVTLRSYTSDITDPTKQFWVRYALNGEDEVRLNGEEKAEINGTEYPIALSFEDDYFSNSRRPSTAGSIFIFVLAGGLLGFAFYCVIWIFIYKNVEAKGELTYAIFVSAAASKLGSAKYMAVTYKFQNAKGEWIEAKTPYTYNGVDSEKLMLLETFKIRYKGNRSLIVENVRGLRL